jgi:hypothetical protein
MKDELKYWRRKWELSEELIYKNAAKSQASFVQNKIVGNLLKTVGFVVSHHYSKSCELPVYFMKMRNGIKIIMRCNFYDWKLSVEIPKEYADLPANYLPEDCLSHDMVENKGEKIPPCYCEGFKKEWCYNAYIPEQPGKKFTIEIPDDERLYVIMHYLKHAYPDKNFNISDDKRSVEELKTNIDNILDANGFNEYREDTSWGKPTQRRVMSAWEIIWRTYCKLDDLSSEIREIYGESMCISNDSQRYSECILRFPEVHKEWLMEEWLFSDEI